MLEIVRFEKNVFRKDLRFYKLLHILESFDRFIWHGKFHFLLQVVYIISCSISTGKVSRKKVIWITFSLNSVSISSIRQLCRILSRQKLFRRKSGSSFHEEIQAVKVYNFKSNNWSFAMKNSWYEFLAILENYPRVFQLFWARLLQRSFVEQQFLE